MSGDSKTYRMVDSGDLFVRLLILLLGLTILGCFPPVETESTELPELRSPDEEHDNPETAESECVKLLLPVSLTR